MEPNPPPAGEGGDPSAPDHSPVQKPREAPREAPTEGPGGGPGGDRPHEPGETLPPSARRILDRSPSERYAGRPEQQDAVAGSAARSAGWAIAGAAVGATLLVGLASPLALAEPLVVVALLVGLVAGAGARRGGATAVPHRRRRAIAVTAALAAVCLAEVVVWLLALAQGGVLSFADYQLQVFGPIALLEPIAAGLAAWATG